MDNREKNRREKSKHIERAIENLSISAEAKDFLETALSMGDGGVNSAKSIPNVLIISPPGTGVTSFTRIYSDIVDYSHVYEIRGASTMLELDFPYSLVESEYDMFFNSPRICAETQNRFWGTFSISFERYGKEIDLIDTTQFYRLKSFVMYNRDNISFIFHITPDFEKKDELINELAQLVNIRVIEFGEQNVESLTAHFISEVEKNVSVKWNEKWTESVAGLISNMCSNEGFRGYRTVNALVMRFQFEWAMVTRTHMEKGKISKDDVFFETLNRISRDVAYSAQNKHCIGFHV